MQFITTSKILVDKPINFKHLRIDDYVFFEKTCIEKLLKLAFTKKDDVILPMTVYTILDIKRELFKNEAKFSHNFITSIKHYRFFSLKDVFNTFANKYYVKNFLCSQILKIENVETTREDVQTEFRRITRLLTIEGEYDPNTDKFEIKQNKKFNLNEFASIIFNMSRLNIPWINNYFNNLLEKNDINFGTINVYNNGLLHYGITPQEIFRLIGILNGSVAYTKAALRDIDEKNREIMIKYSYNPPKLNPFHSMMKQEMTVSRMVNLKISEEKKLEILKQLMHNNSLAQQYDTLSYSNNTFVERMSEYIIIPPQTLFGELNTRGNELTFGSTVRLDSFKNLIDNNFDDCNILTELTARFNDLQCQNLVIGELVNRSLYKARNAIAKLQQV